MNHYQYTNNRRRIPRNRKGSDYIKPVAVVAIFIVILFALWKLIGALFGGGGAQEQSAENVSVIVESGNAKVMTTGSELWETIPNTNLPVYQGEKVQTLSDGRLSLNFFDGSTARLDQSSTLAFDSLAEEGTTSKIGMNLDKGAIWVNTTDFTSGAVDIQVSTANFVAKSSQNAVFAVEAPDKIYVFKGEVEADLMLKDKVIATETIGVGQQLVANESLIASISEDGSEDLVSAVEEAFEKSEWYIWNQKKEGIVIDVNDDESDPEDEADDPSADEDESDPEDEDEDNSEGPSKPGITSPGSDGETIILENVKQNVVGTVASNTAAVEVNGYRLQLYEAGSTEYLYIANAELGNMKVGDNTYSIVAIDEDGNESDPATIILKLPQSVADEAGLDDEDDEEDPDDTPTTGDVAFTGPNSGKSFSTEESSFKLTGTVPSSTERVVVNSYQLQAYQPGSTTFSYNASDDLNTLKLDAVNTYTVEAYNENNALIGTSTLKITVGDAEGTVEDSDEEVSDDEDSDSEASDASSDLSLSISIPSGASTYETTLDQITLGGSAGSAVQSVYLNGSPVSSFSQGDADWSIAVSLSPGENTFSVYGEGADGQTAISNLTVTYQN